ncbi:serine/threonine-protein kinase [Azospirillum sp.]|uniref:serine/threonine-protein kinase n=1 Tax=Azospirillum sp. TaxID=34012 RepID=UPI002D6F9FAA|nr:serine/threonine-protein kinase [Azospirillum sp.]HYD67767.1 serine/threonine-protein kinase [Azospirillum sp.]
MDPKTINRPSTPAPGTVGTIEDVEVCQTLAEYHGLQGRIVMGAVLRQYLDSVVLTPTEVIHVHKVLKPVLEQGQLLENALVRVSTLQARLPGQDPRARRMALQTAVNETQARARAAQLAFADLPRNRPPIEVILALEPGKKTPTGDVEYDMRVALGLELADRRSWMAKLDRLIELLQWERDERLTAAVDGLIADVLCSVAAVHDLYGGPLTPGQAVLRLCELVLGRTTTAPAMGPNRVGVLNAMFRQGKLPQSRTAILDRIRRTLRAPQTLGRAAGDQEADILKAVMAHLLTRTGVVGEGPMAEALTIRYSRRLQQGGASAFRLSMLGIAESLGDLFSRLHYLTAVSGVAAAERHRGEIVDCIEAALGNEMLVENMVLHTPDVALIRESIAGAAEAIARSGLPEEVQPRLALRLAGVVDDFAQRGRLVQRMRQIEPVLRRRIIRLAELATSGLMRDDGALPLLRQHVLEVVKQPQFQMDLVAQQNSEVAQAEIRRLYELLDKLRQGAPPPVATSPTAPTASKSPPNSSPLGTVAVPAPPPPAATRAVTVATAAVPAPLGRPAPTLVLDDARCPNCFEAKPPREACAACGYPQRSDNRAGVHLMPGTALHGRYLTGRVLGQGGFGATYLGWDDRLHVKVAVKEFYPANLITRAPGGSGIVPFSDEHAKGFAAGLGKFLEEARLLARMRDVKEIVGVQDFFEENGTAYLIMELLEGRTFKRYVAESGGRIDPKRALSILSPVMKALQAVHDQGLIHRDVSPDNIFITTTGERKLLDFGAARQAAGDSGMTVILKPGYAPPEQYSQEGRQGPWTDVYAMCATLYCAVAGKAPPDATTRFMNDVVPKPSTLGVAMPPAFEKALLSGLAMRHQERPQSMRDLLKVLTAALG